MKNRFNFNNKLNEFALLFVFILIFTLFSIFAPNFLQVSNMFNIARQITTLGIMAVGMTMVMIAGGIDLSVGYQVSLVNVVCAWLMVNNMSPLFAVLISIVMGTLIGCINGFIIVKTGVAPLIITLGVLNVLNGLSYIVTRGIPIFGFPRGFSFLGQGTIGQIPVSLFIVVAIFAIGAFVINKTSFGRYLYAIGSNEEATKLSGINTGKIKILAFALNGFLTAIGAILLLSRTNSGNSANGVGFEFNVITACVLGGVSANGGKGTIIGVLGGVLIIGILNNGLLLMNVNEYLQLVVKGVLMLIAVIYDTVSRQRSDSIKKIKAINIEN